MNCSIDHYINLNYLPYDKIEAWSNMLAFADGKQKVAEMAELIPGRVENSMGKGQNGGYQHFLLFPNCFQKASVPG